MNNGVKSATTAGLLGIFLGGVGAHNWYLGEKKKGIIHVCLMGSGLLVQIVAALILPNVLSLSTFLTWGSILTVLTSIASLAMAASAIWGLVEGITILTQGDAGLAQKGYAVANPAQGYGQPMNNNMGNINGMNMNNNMGGNMNMNNDMNGMNNNMGSMNGMNNNMGDMNNTNGMNMNNNMNNNMAEMNNNMNEMASASENASNENSANNMGPESGDNSQNSVDNSNQQ